jgi:hypothetical protein
VPKVVLGCVILRCGDLEDHELRLDAAIYQPHPTLNTGSNQNRWGKFDFQRINISILVYGLRSLQPNFARDLPLLSKMTSPYSLEKSMSGLRQTAENFSRYRGFLNQSLHRLDNRNSALTGWASWKWESLKAGSPLRWKTPRKEALSETCSLGTCSKKVAPVAVSLLFDPPKVILEVAGYSKQDLSVFPREGTNSPQEQDMAEIHICRYLVNDWGTINPLDKTRSIYWTVDFELQMPKISCICKTPWSLRHPVQDRLYEQRCRHIRKFEQTLLRRDLHFSSSQDYS